MTAHAMQKDLDRCIAAGMDACLTKPVKPSQLIDSIMDLLGCKEAMSVHSEESFLSKHKHALAGTRVLVAEDSELNRAVIIALMKDAGIYVEIAENGKIALEKVTRLPWKYFDLVLMDIQMPLMDGYETTRRVRQWEFKVHGSNLNPPPSKTIGEPSEIGIHKAPISGSDKRGRLPIIALTAHVLPGEKEKCLSAGMDDYLSKPIDEEQLYRVLKKWTTSNKEDMNMNTPLKSSVMLNESIKLDVPGALKRLGGREHLYKKVLQKFVPECSRAYESISRQLAAGDMEAASRTAHTIKGASAAIGANVLSRIAEDIEKGINDRQGDISLYMSRFKDVMGRTLTLVDEYLESETVDLSAKAVLNKNASKTDLPLEDSLEQLVNYLKTGDMRAKDAWELSKGYFESKDDPLISDFIRAMDRLDFDRASEMLYSLMKDPDQRKTENDRSKYAQG
jgi:CheY-like chemotaxis protein/HPt (histidine-containing phosphotransfer) domain-containing protein